MDNMNLPAMSVVLAIPLSTFLITMIGVHFLVGFVEGLVTVTVLAYLQQLRPDIVADSLPGTVRLSRNVPPPSQQYSR